MGTLSGPMFEPAQSEFWKSSQNKSGAHYNQFSCKDENGMAALRGFFPTCEPDDMNLVFFSTSGVHGSYNKIEDAAKGIRGERDEYGDVHCQTVTFVIVQPRICCLRYGNCIPQTQDDIDFLDRLRFKSWAAASDIGRMFKPAEELNGPN